MTRRELFKSLIFTPVLAAFAVKKKKVGFPFGHFTFHDIPVVTDLQWDKNRIDYIAQDAFYGGSAGSGKSEAFNLMKIKMDEALQKMQKDRDDISFLDFKE